jgi:hypothetical protein
VNARNARHMRAVGGGQAVRRAIAAAPAPEVADGPSLLSVIVQAFRHALDGHHALPGCEPCVAVAKQAERAHGVAVGNARAAAEPPPEFSLPDIQQAITQQDGRWVCFAHYELSDE